MCANILANAGVVELQGELGGPAGSRFMAWLEALKLQRSDADPAAFYDLARQAFRLGAAGRPAERPEARWFGHKTPRHERYFRRYEVVFDDPDNRPVYVYCLRNPFDTWRSYQAMPWNKFETADAFLKAWLRSVATYEMIAAKAPGRILVFNLDAMLRAEDWAVYLGPALFEPLGLSSDTFRRPVRTLGNSNSSLNKTGARPQPISDADRQIIAAHPEVRRITAEHFPWLDLGPAPTGLLPLLPLARQFRFPDFRRAAGQAWRSARQEWARARRT